jgi:3',5'-cyclic AMP phosphodiesterase CpdA
VLVAHISDFHIFSKAPETSLVRLDVAEAARRIVADITAFSPALDAVMFTGDLTDGGSPDDYALLDSILAPIGVPVFVVPGNHDKRPTLRTAFADRLPFAEGPFLNYATSVGDLRVIGLDTLIEGRIEGRLDPGTLDWLAERLADAVNGPTYILMHHPPLLSGIHGLDAMSLVEGGEALGKLVRGHPGTLRILSGHIHRPFQGLWNGVFTAIGGSPAFQIGLDLHPGAPEPGLVAEPYSYFIHRLDGDQLCVHRRSVAI